MNASSTAVVPAAGAGALTTIYGGPVNTALDETDVEEGGGERDPTKALAERLGDIKADLTSDETRLRKAALKRRAKTLQKVDVVVSNPALQAALIPAVILLKPFRPIYRMLTAIDRVRQEAMGNLMKVGVIYSKLQSIVNIVQGLHDRITGTAADALSTHHLDLFNEKLARSASIMERVAADLEVFANTSAMERSFNSARLDRELDDLDSRVEEMLADLHAHSSVASIAIQRRVARRTEEAITLANDNYDRLTRQSTRAEAALTLLTAHRAAQESQVTAVRQIRAAVAGLNLEAAFLRDITNPQVAAVWKYMVPQGSSFTMPLDRFALALAPAVESKYAEFLTARAGLSARDAVKHAVRCITSAAVPLISLDDLDVVRRSDVDDSAFVSAIQFNKAFAYEGDAATPALPDWLVWKYAGWAVVAETKVGEVRSLAADFTIGRVAADKAAQLAETTLARLLDAWDLPGSPALEYARSLAPAVGWTASGKLPKRFAPLVRALTALAKVLADALADARDAAWADESEPGALSADATKLVAQFPESLCDAQADLVKAAKRVGLSDEAAKGLNFGPKARAAAAKAATGVVDAQLETLFAVDDALDANPQLATSQLLFDWSEVTPAPGASGVWGPALLCGRTPVEILRCPADRAKDVLATLALGLVPLAQAAHVRRVHGFLPPSSAASGSGDWGVVAERVLRDVRVAGMSPADRAQVALDVANGLTEMHVATCKTQTAMLPVGLTVPRLAFMRNVLGSVVAKVPVPGLARMDAVMPRVDAMQADTLALAGVVRELVLAGSGADGPESPVAPLRALVAAIEKGKGAEDEEATPRHVAEMLETVLARLRASAAASATANSSEVTNAGDLELLDGLTTSAVTIIDAAQLDTLRRAAAAGDSDLTYDAALMVYRAAVRPIQISRSPYDNPDYDVRGTVLQLLRAGVSGHVPMALVTAADLYYFGAVPRAPAAEIRTSASWDIAFDLYDVAAGQQRCEYACAGLGDLVLFELGLKWRSLVAGPAGDDAARLATALALYERAFGDIHHPGRATAYTEDQAARVYCGRADVHFALGELASSRSRDAAARGTRAGETAAAAVTAEAAEHYARALADYQLAVARFPNYKRALARLAVFSVRGIAGEPVSFRAASERLAAARSRTNGRREMQARAEMFAAMGNDAARDAVEAEIAVYKIPDF
ncbi:hypothetical protein H9P43_004062 [Blastocladiella emersonii ATCC 22665]|nr:hypothetical protein H9P43_004062 [Blastocladiella emersonii ATCC 22665]